jgi:hypothetical protein
MGNTTTTALPYDGARFVDREDLIEVALVKARKLLCGEPVDKRTVAFFGPRGSGKSWLLEKLYDCFQEEEFRSLLVLRVILRDPATQKLLTVDQILHQAVQQIAVIRTSTPAGHNATAGLYELSTRLLEEVKPWLEQHPLVLLVDSVDEAPPDLLQGLETYLLAPLVKEPQILVVLAGRTRDPRPEGGYTWKSPELKLYSEEYDLPPFDEGLTRAQLEKLRDLYPDALQATAQIVQEGGGYPLSNALLASEVAGRPPEWKDKAAALKKCADALLEGVESDETKGYFWALCVLRVFFEDNMPPLLAVYFGKDPSAWPFRKCREIREEMVRTRLARWDEGRNGFVIDEAVRTALENALREGQPELWARLHEAACKLYTQWVATYPRAADRWKPEADYHCAVSPGKPSGCPAS